MRGFLCTLVLYSGSLLEVMSYRYSVCVLNRANPLFALGHSLSVDTQELFIADKTARALAHLLCEGLMCDVGVLILEDVGWSSFAVETQSVHL